MLEVRFAAIAEQLLRAGVAPRNVRRTVFELAGHFQDLVDEMKARGLSAREAELEASARLGADKLVAHVLARPELRSWARRWPLAAFALLPAATYVALLASALVALVVCLELAEHAFGIKLAHSNGLQFLGSAFLKGITWVLPAIPAAACCAIALGRRAPPVWPVVGVALISSLAALLNLQLQIPPSVPKAALSAGFGFSTDDILLPAMRVGTTMAVVLLPYFLYLWYRSIRLRAD